LRLINILTIAILTIAILTIPILMMIVMGRCNCVNCGCKIVSTLTDDLKIYDFVVEEIKKQEFNGCRLIQQLIILNYNNLSLQQRNTLVNYTFLHATTEDDPYLLYLHLGYLKCEERIALLASCMCHCLYEALNIISHMTLPYCTSQSLKNIFITISNMYVVYCNSIWIVLPYFSPGIVSHVSKKYIHPELAIQYLYVYV
jgi:hypothetical protein